MILPLGIILAKGQLDRSYAFWTMPSLLFSLKKIFWETLYYYLPTKLFHLPVSLLHTPLAWKWLFAFANRYPQRAMASPCRRHRRRRQFNVSCCKRKLRDICRAGLLRLVVVLYTTNWIIFWVGFHVSKDLKIYPGKSLRRQASSKMTCRALDLEKDFKKYVILLCLRTWMHYFCLLVVHARGNET